MFSGRSSGCYVANASQGDWKHGCQVSGYSSDPGKRCSGLRFECWKRRREVDAGFLLEVEVAGLVEGVGTGHRETEESDNA